MKLPRCALIVTNVQTAVVADYQVIVVLWSIQMRGDRCVGCCL